MASDGLSELARFGFAAPNAAARREWATERMWDYSEGKLSFEGLNVLLAMVLGWCDVATADEVRQYRELSRRLNDLRNANL